MKIPQISVFVENKPGHLNVPCRLLADAGISMVTLSLADTQQFGVLRLIVRQWQRAREVLEAAQLVVAVTEVLAIEVPDQPGGLADLLDIFQQAGINVGGWIEQGITYDAWNPVDRFNGPMCINDRSGEYQLNQAWLYFVRPTKTDGCGFDIGGRIDAPIESRSTEVSIPCDDWSGVPSCRFAGRIALTSEDEEIRKMTSPAEMRDEGRSS